MNGMSRRGFDAMSMRANITDLKNRLSEYLTLVERGEEVVVCRRNTPIARITPVAPQANRSKSGWGKGTIRILGPVTGSIMEEDARTLQ